MGFPSNSVASIFMQGYGNFNMSKAILFGGRQDGGRPCWPWDGQSQAKERRSEWLGMACALRVHLSCRSLYLSPSASSWVGLVILQDEARPY